MKIYKSKRKKIEHSVNVLVCIGEVGVAGTVVDGIADLVMGFDDKDNKSDMYKALLGGGKKFVSSIGDIAEEAFKSSDKQDLKKLFIGDWETGSLVKDMNEKMTKYDVSTKWEATVFDEIDSYNFKAAENVGEKIKVGTKWAGLALSGVVNGVDNYEEHGGMNNARFWAETATETAVGVALDIGAKVAATAAVGAVLGPGAPVVLVGVAAVGISWVADSVTKWATKKLTEEEKDLEELISDTLIDGVKKGFERKKNAVKNLFGNIGAGWRACFG